MKKTVSIIVPVYNVEKYLQKCITTIVNQTYKNLEIILVDDGSTDGSGALCDELAATDERISVIHKENGGLSDARNAGLDASTGDYIAFVDSDDYVDSDFVELLVNSLEEHNADVSCCRFTRVWEDGRAEQIGNDGITESYEGADALKEYLWARKMDPFVCNKLFKAQLLGNQTHNANHRRFIKGILGEDNPFCIELFKATNRVVLVGASKYNYLQARDGAITSSRVTQRKIDSIFYWDTVRLDCKENYPELEKYALRRELLFYIGLYNGIYKDSEYKADADKIRAFVKEHNREVQASDICEKTVKLSVRLLSVSPVLYGFVMRAYKKFIGEARL